MSKLKCPITGFPTNNKCHRQCDGNDCYGEDCWDCCADCQRYCKEPARNEDTVQLAEGLDVLDVEEEAI